MNKQELAARIWESANNMRSKIEASEYKDYILSLIFYKFLSDKLISYCKDTLGADDEWIKENLNEENENIVTDCLRTHGYFISYNNLFTYWVEDPNFEIANVRDAISSFKRLASSDKSIYQNIYDGIFDTLQLGLSKLGDTSGSQTKTIKQLLSIIEPIPTDGKQGYDVLGFIYEYLINQFASNAGKKAGEFYTPHEVSQVMSEIIAHHLKDRDSIEIYDPTSGSGSLLITIGNSASKYINKDKITYFAQELKENTYSLTRMNLVMHDINPANIKAKNADTLVDDWPIDESDQKPLLVDAVVSNPPYSQKWEPAEDRRFKNYGIAPKSKADFAFLLHDLYHLESDGIMAIVLPHGVLFRGNEEGKIRRNLIENNNIDAIIGLPANIFFGTSIPTCILILKKNRPTNDILVIDASKGFVKADDKNKLRAKDIKKIADTVINRVSIPSYSSVVPKETIRENDYNLNIPRYVDSNNRNESYDLYSSMFGGVPNGDIEKYNKFWDIFPSLKDDLFEKLNSNYSKLKVENINETILNNKDVKEYITKFNNSFEDIDKWLKRELIDNMQFVDITKEENFITDEIFTRLENIPLIDKYDAYEKIDDAYSIISTDFEIINTETNENNNPIRQIDTFYKLNQKKQETVDRMDGHVIPFALIEKLFLISETKQLEQYNNQLEQNANEIKSIFEDLSEDDKTALGDLINEDETDFVNKQVNDFAKKNKKTVFLENSAEAKAMKVAELLSSNSSLAKQIKEMGVTIQSRCVEIINNLNEDEISLLLSEKWITPLVENIKQLPLQMLTDFERNIEKVGHKYDATYQSIQNEIEETQSVISGMIDELTGNEFDMQGLLEFKKLLKK